MDHFKEVNDTFGHGAGDRVLETLTERLTGKLPEGTVLGRLAGDEFALFIDGISDANGARSRAAPVARTSSTWWRCPSMSAGRRYSSRHPSAWRCARATPRT